MFKRGVGMIVTTGLLALAISAPADALVKEDAGKLVPSDLTVAKDTSNGLRAHLEFTVTNHGRKAERPRAVRLSLIQEGSNERRLGNLEIPKIKPGESVTESATRRVRKPATPGTYRAQTCVRSAGARRCTVSDGEIVLEPAALDADPSPLAFPDVVVGDDDSGSVTITNTGDFKTDVPDLAISGSGASQFAIGTNGCGSALAAGQSCEAEIGFAPTAAGVHDATLDVDAVSSTLAVPLQGTALEQASISIAPPSHAFGSQEANTTSGPQTFTVTNDGDVPTSTLAVALVGPDQGQFSVPGAQDACSGQTLAAGNSCTLDVKFAPTAAGSKVASIQAQATTGGTTSASLSGTGLKPAELQITPTSKDFGKVLIGTVSPSTTFTVENVGEVPTSAINANTTGSQFGLPLPDDDCSTVVLDPGETCTVAVVFQPTAHGDQSGSVQATATKGGTASSSLSGFGADPAKIEITPANYDFGNVKTGTAVTKTFTATNVGDLPSQGIGTAVVNDGIYSLDAPECMVATLAPGGTCQLKITFTPNANGGHDGKVWVFDSSQGTGSGVPTDVTGTGVATDAQLAWDPATRLYNPLPFGGQFSTPVYLRNDGQADAHGLTFAPGSSSTANVTSVSFQPGIPNGSSGPPCGSDLPGGTSCTGFMIWSANSVLTPTKASLKVTGVPGGTVEFVAQFGQSPP